MNIKRLQLALEEVCGDQYARKCLSGRRWTGIWKEIWSEEVDQWVDEQRSGVLNDKDQLP